MCHKSLPLSRAIFSSLVRAARVAEESIGEARVTVIAELVMTSLQGKGLALKGRAVVAVVLPTLPPHKLAIYRRPRLVRIAVCGQNAWLGSGICGDRVGPEACPIGTLTVVPNFTPEFLRSCSRPLSLPRPTNMDGHHSALAHLHRIAKAQCQRRPCPTKTTKSLC